MPSETNENQLINETNQSNKPNNNDNNDEDNKVKSNNKYSWLRTIYFILLHLFVISIYALPEFTPSEYNKRGNNPVLDELHIISESNLDINGRENESLYSILQNVFTNDYWGRPMNSSSSHKSWRPLSVLLFRYVRGLSITTTTKFHNNNKTATTIINFLSKDINIHRIVNILTHATISELVSILAIKICIIPTGTTTNNQLIQNNVFFTRKLILYTITKILFILHPTHVEVTANVANRPHLLALMCSLILSNPDINIILYIISLLFGYLFCETFLFQIIPAGVMIVSIQYIRLFYHPNNNSIAIKDSKRQSIFKQIILHTIIKQLNILFRLILLILSGIIYYFARYYYDTLSIPTGLIRPAENPFYKFEGWDRFRNYSYVLSIHIAKQWDIDFIGFSHEYGYECIKAITNIRDNRLLIPASQVIIHIIIGIYLLIQQSNHSIISIGLILYFIHLSWMITLFPVAGIIKVGTFIADRIVVASTVSVSIITANILTHWVCPIKQQQLGGIRKWQKIIILIFVTSLMWKRIYQRSCEWMDSLPLLESSLKTCPNFAKAHLEISKIYSGLYPDKFNLKKSRWHLEQVELIDKNFCDVHQQFAHISVQEHKYIEFEERLTNALLCPFTMGGSIELWKRYWNIALDEKQNPINIVNSARMRHERYQKIINEAIINENKNNNNNESSSQQLPDDKSPLIHWKK